MQSASFQSVRLFPGLRLCALLLLLFPAALRADEIGDALNASQQSLKAARESQQRINRLDDEARALREKRQSLEWRLQQSAAYALQLEQAAADQERVRAELDLQRSRMGDTGSELLPLMRRMLDELEAFIGADLPFRQAQRQERLAELKTLLDSSGRSPAEKYRRVLEAYRSEVDYGNSLGVEEAGILIDGVTHPASLVRIGRVGLYALTDEGGRPAHWNHERHRWEWLDRRLADNVETALAVARGQIPPELLSLPVRVPRSGP
jgi:hypothetical protein